MFVHANPLATETFFEYSKSLTIKIEKRTEIQFRVDIILYQYNDESLKSPTRNIRGDGKRCKLTPNGKVPKNWKCFLRNSKNKTDLIEFLAKSIYYVEKGIAYATVANNSICNKIIRRPIECTHEEADTRLFGHLKHAIQTDSISSASI